MQKKVTRCFMCHNIITINYSTTFFICPECKKSLTIQQLEDRLNEK